MKIRQALVSGCVAAALAAPFGACAQFSSGECTDKAVCDPNETGTNDGAFADVPADNVVVDVNVDTFVGPDGNVPDGECNGGVEDCANGKDDNCNGLVDCEDPVCQGAGYVCTGPPPSGWNGPVALATLTGGTIPSCAGAYATAAQSGHTGLTANPTQCSCGCGTPTNVQCNQVSIDYYMDACNTVQNSDGLPANFCVNGGGASITNVEGITNPTAFNGNCTASPSKTVPPVSWAKSYAACSYDAPSDTGGCTGGSLCVQSPGGGFSTNPCVWQANDVACPSGPYSVKTLFYDSLSDTRDCSTCTCTATAGTCTAAIQVYTTVNCAGSPAATIQADNSCHAVSGAYSAQAGTITTTAGTCGNNGTGAAIGSASAAGPVTVCCAP